MIGVPPDPPGFVASGLDLTLPGEERVAIAGDWHGNIRWIQTALPRLHRIAPDVKTMLQVGDFGYWLTGERPGKGFLAACDYWAKSAGIERIMFLPGNHEQWGRLLKIFATHPGAMVQVTQRVWAMPRGFRFTLGGREFMAFGGAASHDIEWRTEDLNWWPEEVATITETVGALTGAPFEVLLSHDSPHPTPLVGRIIQNRRSLTDIDAAIRDRVARWRLFRVWDQHRPPFTFHGHFHVRDFEFLPDARRVYSLGMDGDDTNIVIFDLAALEVHPLDDVPPSSQHDA